MAWNGLFYPLGLLLLNAY